MVDINHRDFYTCFCTEGEGHSLCPHKHQCILSSKRQAIEKELGEISKKIQNSTGYDNYKYRRDWIQTREKLKTLHTKQGGYD